MRAIVLAGVFVTALATAAYAADGVIEINQARALAGGVTPDDTPGFPVTISLPGSYRLTGNLLPGAGFNAINVAANNVTIDLNGFSIVSPNIGIMASGYSNITVANGSVLAAKTIGIFLGEVGRVERVRVTADASVGGWGIIAQSGVVVSGCSVSGATTGIEIHSGVVTGNIITHNGRGVVATKALITGNVIEENSSWGLDLGSYVGYSGNTLRENHGASGNPNVRGGTSLGANLCDTTLCP